MNEDMKRLIRDLKPCYGYESDQGYRHEATRIIDEEEAVKLITEYERKPIECGHSKACLHYFTVVPPGIQRSECSSCAELLRVAEAVRVSCKNLVINCDKDYALINIERLDLPVIIKEARNGK